MFRLEIDATDASPTDVARILRHVAAEVERAVPSGPIRDHNGMRIGSWIRTLVTR